MYRLRRIPALFMVLLAMAMLVIPAAPAAASQGGSLPVKQIERILQAQGTVSNGVLTVEQDRNDLHITGPGGIPFKPAWEVDNELYFQPLGDGRALLNGDVPLLTSETQPFIDKLLANNLNFMAFHQHFFGLHPMVYFIHFSGVGDPIHLAHAIASAISVTGTPLPQRSATPTSWPGRSVRGST